MKAPKLVKVPMLAKDARIEVSEIMREVESIADSLRSDGLQVKQLLRDIETEKEAVLMQALKNHFAAKPYSLDELAALFYRWGVTATQDELTYHREHQADTVQELYRQRKTTAEQAHAAARRALEVFDLKHVGPRAAGQARAKLQALFAQPGWLALPALTADNYRAPHPVLALFSARYRAVQRLLAGFGDAARFFTALDRELAVQAQREQLQRVMDNTGHYYNKTVEALFELQNVRRTAYTDAEMEQKRLRVAASALAAMSSLPSEVQQLLTKDTLLAERFAQLTAQATLLETQKAALARVTNDCYRFNTQLTKVHDCLRKVDNPRYATVALNLITLRTGMQTLRGHTKGTTAWATRVRQANWQQLRTRATTVTPPADDAGLDVLQLYWMSVLLDALTPAVASPAFVGAASATGAWDSLGLGAATPSEQLLECVERQVSASFTALTTPVLDDLTANVTVLNTEVSATSNPVASGESVVTETSWQSSRVADVDMGTGSVDVETGSSDWGIDSDASSFWDD